MTSLENRLQAFVKLIPYVGNIRRLQLIRNYKKSNSRAHSEEHIMNNKLYDKNLGCLRFSGSWYSIGMQISSIGGVDNFTDMVFAQISPHQEKSFLSMSETSFKYVLGLFPELLPLFEGLAKGSGVPLDRLVLANFITTINPDTIDQSCSAICWTSPNGSIFGQSLDLGLVNTTTTALIEATGYPHILAHMNIGSLWFTTGVNSHGLIVGGASVNAKKLETSHPCFPHPFLQFLLLCRSSSTKNAVHIIEESQPYGSNGDASTHIIADKNEMAYVEIFGDHIEIEYCKKATANNHFVSEKMKKYLCSDKKAKIQNKESRKRRESGWRILSKATPNISDIENLLATNSNQGGWLRSAIPPDDGWTTSRYVIDWEVGTFTAWHGPYPSNPQPISINLDSLFTRQN